MIDLFFDTETTGFPNSKLPLDDPKQCGCIQLGMAVYDNGYPVFELGTLIKSNKPMNEGALNAHGIKPELYNRHGRNIKDIANIFLGWVKVSDRIVAHNIKFDTHVMQILLHEADCAPDFLVGKNAICTMLNTINVCRIPNKNGYAGFKWPKLIEAYKMIIDPKGFEGAHNALVDVNACAKIFYALEEEGII